MTDENLPPWIEEAQTTITTQGTESGAGGLIERGSDRALMLNVRPAVGNGRLIPYTRIEEVEVDEEATCVTIYAAHCVVTVRGSQLDKVITSIQRGAAWSLHVGQSTSNDAKIEEILIALASDHTE